MVACMPLMIGVRDFQLLMIGGRYLIPRHTNDEALG